jgi:thiol:disulfide interchange protein
MRLFPAFAAVLLVTTGSHALAQLAGSNNVSVSLVAEAKVVGAGKPFTVGLKMEHPPGFHTYWINPGVGKPTTITWDLPAGWSAGELLWPIPHLYDDGFSKSHTYEGTVYHLVEITPAAGFTAGATATLKGEAVWFECQASGCRRGATNVSVTVTAGAATTPDPAIKAAFDTVRAQQPRTTEAWAVTAVESPADLVITLTPKTGANPEPGNVYFFERNKVTQFGPPKVEKKEGTLVVTVAKEEGATDKPAGFLHASKGWLADGSMPALAYPATTTAATRAAAVPTRTPSSGRIPATTLEALDEIIPKEGPKYVSLSGEASKPLTFWWALVLAFIGGIILNAMPCVFPVLGIKVLGFVQQSGEDAQKVRKHGMVFTLGLLVAMWVLAGVLIALNLGGQRLGWGFQQQSPGFTAFIALLLFVMGLNLAGVFEMGTSLTTVGGGLMDKGGYAGSFFTGALTTLIATPCSGPFLGAAMGYTLQQPPLPALLLFTGFGLGIALPSLILTLNPVMLRWLPRPGAWMETFKVAMAFPIFATVVFFLNSFAIQSGTSGLISLLIAVVLIGLALWVYGHWSTPLRTPRVRWIGRGAAVLFGALGVWAAAGAARAVPETKALEAQVAVLQDQVTDLLKNGGKFTNTPSKNVKADDFAWEKWSPERVRDLRKQGRAIFTDFTAGWCLTCQTNKRVVFGSPGSDAVKARFKELNIVALKADWTDDDPVIAEFLYRNGIPAIPANFIYPEDAGKPPILLPQGLITQGQVIEGIEKAAANRRAPYLTGQ